MKTITHQTYKKLLNTHGTTFICASDRIWRDVEKSYNESEQSKNKAAWVNRLDAYYLPRFLEKLADEYLPENVVLSPAQEVVACKRAVDQSNNFDPQELSTIGLAKKFRSALNTATDYRISEEQIHYMISHEASRFYDWKERLCEQNDKEGTIFLSELNKELIAAIGNGEFSMSKCYCFVGFIEIPPMLKDLYEALEKAGAITTSIEFPYPSIGQISLGTASTEFDELRMAAKWLLLQAKKNPNGNYAMVVPEIDAYRDAVESAFEDVYERSIGVTRKPWVFAGGRRLTEYPMISDALDILMLAKGPNSETWSRVLLSPYIEGYGDESAERAMLDILIRKIPKRSIRIQEVLAIATKKFPDAIITQKIKAFQLCFESVADVMCASRWAITFDLQLKAIGWLVGRKLTSEEHQTQSAFYSQLTSFVSLDIQIGNVRQMAAVGWLRECLMNKRFEAEVQGRTPILILSYWDSLCVQFDSAWVVSANSSELPKVVRPSSFLPLQLQVNAGVPEANFDVMHSINETHASYLTKVGRRTVVSYSKMVGDMECMASPLIEGLKASERIEFSYAENNVSLPTVEVSDPMPPLQDSEIENLNNIVSIIKDSSTDYLCAQLIHRFKIKEFPISEYGVTASLSGMLVQSSLEYFWESVKTQLNLKSLSIDELNSEIEICIAKSISVNESKLKYISKRTLDLEVSRIHRVILKWLDFEAARELPFKVIGNEVSASITLNKKTFNLSVDRIDEVLYEGSPKVLYMDHKTGADIDANGMLPSSLTNPQLPIYSMADIEGYPAADGIALAQIRSDKLRVASLTSFDAELHTGRGGNHKKDFWDKCCEEWKINIPEIYESFTSGSIERGKSVHRYHEYLAPLL
mgnify:CR=1 FL=1